VRLGEEKMMCDASDGVGHVVVGKFPYEVQTPCIGVQVGKEWQALVTEVSMGDQEPREEGIHEA